MAETNPDCEEYPEELLPADDDDKDDDEEEEPDPEDCEDEPIKGTEVVSDAPVTTGVDGKSTGLTGRSGEP